MLLWLVLCQIWIEPIQSFLGNFRPIDLGLQWWLTMTPAQPQSVNFSYGGTNSDEANAFMFHLPCLIISYHWIIHRYMLWYSLLVCVWLHPVVSLEIWFIHTWRRMQYDNNHFGVHVQDLLLQFGVQNSICLDNIYIYSNSFTAYTCK